LPGRCRTISTTSSFNALTFFDGAPQQIVCDNLRSGITRACFYEPLVNRTYADMARHYRTTVIPARPYKARDKAKVEVGVQVVQRWILTRLRHRRFFSLSELNSAIRALPSAPPSMAAHRQAGFGS
jgi:transposase